MRRWNSRHFDLDHNRPLSLDHPGMLAKRAQPCWKFRLGGVMFDIVGIVMLETPMSNNSEGAAGDLTADLAAVRQDVARLAETVSELLQHQMADAQENVPLALFWRTKTTK
jgi:hypothetical protein